MRCCDHISRSNTMLKRDPKFIASHVTVKDGAYYTDTLTMIEFPKWYSEKELFVTGDVSYVYGLFAIVIGDSYSVSRIPTVINTKPVSITEVDRDGETYVQLFYGKGSKVLETTRAIMQPFLAYNFFDSYFMQAKVPWYITPEDLCYIMDNTVSYGGTNLGANQISNELLTGFISRTEKDKAVFYRLNPTGKPRYVDLMDVRYSSLSTTNKLAGNYFNESVTSALIQKETKPTTLENHVRV